MNYFTKPSVIKQLLKTENKKPLKKFGQNFLINDGILKKIVESAQISQEDMVLEIGAGLGALTDVLREQARAVFAVEIDKGLFRILESTFASAENVILCQDDVLAGSFDQIFGEWLRAKQGKLPLKYKIIANIPYNITSYVIRKFLTYPWPPELIVFTIQKEVAQRIVAAVGDMSLLAISVRYYGEPKIIRSVNRRNFYPEPTVDSAIIRIDLSKPFRKMDYPFTDEFFFQVVKAGFSSKRKTLLNNLSNHLDLSKDQVREMLIRLEMRVDIRAQMVTMEQWEKIVIFLATK